MFEKELRVIEEIGKLKEKYNLSAEKVFVLRILKLAEIQNIDYEKMKDYFIKSCKNCETKQEETLTEN